MIKKVKPKSKPRNRVKLTTKKLNEFNKSAKLEEDLWDSEVNGFHVRMRTRGPVFRLSYYNNLGQRRVFSIGLFGKLTADQARKIAIEKSAQVVLGVDPIEERNAVREKYREEVQKTVQAYLEGPYASYQSRLQDGKGTLALIRRNFPNWMARPMSSLTRRDVEEWQEEQESIDRKKEEARNLAISDGLAPPRGRRDFQTLKRAYDALHAMLEHATLRGLIDKNPLKGVKLQSYVLPDKEERMSESRRHFRKGETENFFKGLHLYNEKLKEERRNSRAHGKKYLPDLDQVKYASHHVPFMLFMYCTGFRHGDIFQLRWQHIDFDNQKIRKVISKTSRHHPDPMTFPMSSLLLEVMLVWHEQSNKPGTGLVFPSPVTGRELTNKSMDKAWAQVKKLGGLPESLVMYSLRHNFASQLVMAGVDLLTVSKLMAHTNIETTIRYYSHLCPNHARSAVDLLSGFNLPE